MKRLLAAILSASLLLTGCTAERGDLDQRTDTVRENVQEEVSDVLPQTHGVEFDDLGNKQLLQYVEDSVYATTAEELGSDDCVIESVVATYVSKEYLEELNYNARENIYFGYKLSEIEAQFDGAKYVFALDENGKTEVRAFEAYDDTFDQVLKNIAIGSGVILVCVTVSVVAGAVALPAAATVSTIFAASAKTGTTFALTSGALGAIASGTIRGFETGDVETALKSAVLTGSEGFKWAAVTGVIGGGVNKALQLKSSAVSSIPTARESERKVLQKLGGSEQKSYLHGKEVAYGTPGSTRPDVVRNVGGRLEAVEVKNYDLNASRSPLATVLKRQLTERKTHLPDGATQRIVLDVTGRGYSPTFLKEVREDLGAELNPIYPKIPIDIMK